MRTCELSPGQIVDLWRLRAVADRRTRPSFLSTLFDGAGTTAPLPFGIGGTKNFCRNPYRGIIVPIAIVWLYSAFMRDTGNYLRARQLTSGSAPVATAK